MSQNTGLQINVIFYLIDIDQLNTDIAKMVVRQNELRTAIDMIVAKIET